MPQRSVPWLKSSYTALPAQAVPPCISNSLLQSKPAKAIANNPFHSHAIQDTARIRRNFCDELLAPICCHASTEGTHPRCPHSAFRRIVCDFLDPDPLSHVSNSHRLNGC